LVGGIPTPNEELQTWTRYFLGERLQFGEGIVGLFKSWFCLPDGRGRALRGRILPYFGFAATDQDFKAKRLCTGNPVITAK